MRLHEAAGADEPRPGDRVEAPAADEIGPQLEFPLPAAEVGDHQLGLNAGLTATIFTFCDPFSNRVVHSTVGIGLDAAYHYWPVSSAFKATFERGLFGILKIGDPAWNISALQATGHVKILAPWRSAIRRWLQIGAGLYRVNPRLEFMGSKLDSKWERGAYTSVGFDYKANPHLRMGLDASYHHLWLKEDMGSDLDAFEVGTHVLFGSR